MHKHMHKHMHMHMHLHMHMHMHVHMHVHTGALQLHTRVCVRAHLIAEAAAGEVERDERRGGHSIREGQRRGAEACAGERKAL